jgi:glycosyltransferase involved in cell wall biosynthesis
MLVSVVICSHNSRLDYLGRVLEALRAQTLPAADWELCLVDNASREPLAGRVNLTGLPAARVVRNDVPELEAGLVDARSLGVRSTAGGIVIFVDDDNVIAPDYLAHAVAIARAHPKLGAWSGNVTLLYEKPELALPRELESTLCQRVVTAPLVSDQVDHHESTPWGAGMCVRREVAVAHLAKLEREPERRQLDPVGRSMRFGGDTDLVYTGLEHGFTKGIFPELHITHLIPPRRCDLAFVARAIEAGGYSATLHGWINTGTVAPPRTDWRYYVGELLRWPRRSRWQRLILRQQRRGHWRAYHELRDQKPRRFSGATQPSPSP